MESLAFYRAIRSGWINFWRNFWLSAAATLVMVVTLAMLTLTLITFNVTNIAVKNIQERVDISVYFKGKVAENQILNIKSHLESLSQVSTIKYISAQQALDDFKQKHAGNALIAESLAQLTDNPLPATLQIKAKTLEQYPQIAAELTKPDYQTYIQKVNFEDNRTVIERLSRILNTIKKLGLGMAVIFSFIAVLVIFNTIRLTIYNRREEVEIMKLVGATNWYIRWPFIVESILYGLAASIITILMTIPILNYLLPRLNLYLGTTLNDKSSSFSLGNIFLLQLGIAMLLGIISSSIAIRRYLKV
jgi:cell division transport system permease protein